MVRHAETEPEAEAEPGPIDRDERLGEAIEAYLERVEAGHPPDPESFAAGYPELGGDLVAALDGLAMVEGLVGGSGSGPGGLGHRLEEGRRVAGYRIVRELGRGGMGVVYEAVHVGLDRPVALKVLNTHATPDSSGRRRFLNEAKTAAGLHHTHIVPVFDVGQVGGLCYYAMQRIEGSGLDRVLRHLRRDRAVAAGTSHASASHRPGRPSAAPPKPEPAPALSLLGDETLSWGGGLGPGGPFRRGEAVDEPPPFVPPRGSGYYRWVADVGRQAAEALSHAHKGGVIHRDIKPSNLLVDARGQVWVADFGLARRLADPGQTQVDSLLGTPRYMSPEQARPGAVDGRADIYSLGATLYELITLRPPFDGQSAAELVAQIADQEPPRPRKADPRVPLDLETILLKALAKRPDDRYATAQALADDLARFLAHEPVRARRIGPAGRLWRFARRHPSIAAVTSAASIIVLTTATVAHVNVMAERDEAIKARRDARLAQEETESALGKMRDARLAGLEKHAAVVFGSSRANRRSDGLELLKQAAGLGPDPATMVRLRDQAVAFLSARDVEARPPIATPFPPRGLAFGPGGLRIAAFCDDNDLRTWAIKGGEPVAAVALPAARGGGGGGGRGREPGAQPKGRPFFGPPRVAVSGSAVAVARPDGAGVRLFDINDRSAPDEDMAMKGHDVIALVAAPVGRNLVTIDRPWREPRGPEVPKSARPEPDEVRVTLWDRDRPDSPTNLPVPPTRADSSGVGRSPRPPLVAIAPDGSTVAVARYGEAEVALFDGKGRPLDPPTVDAQVAASALALGPTGLLAVAGGGEIVVWNLSPRKPLPGLGRRQGSVSLLRFSPLDGSLLAAAVGPAGGVELWDLSAHDPVALLPTRDWVDDLAFAPDGLTLAASQSSSIAIWSIAEPSGQVQLPEAGDRPNAIAFGPGDRLAIASQDNQISGPLRLWTDPGRSPPEVQTWGRARPTAVAFDLDGRIVTLEPRDLRLRWFDPSDPEPVAEVALPDLSRGGRGPMTKGEGPGPGRGFDRGLLTRSRDGQTLAFLRSGEVLLWRAEEPDALTHPILKGAREPLTPGQNAPNGRRGGNLVALSPDGSRLYHCGPAGDSLRAYDLKGPGEPRLLWSAPVREPSCLAIAPDGRTLAVGERPDHFALVVAADGAVRRVPAPDPGAEAAPNRVESLAFDPKGRLLAVGARDQVRLWALDGRPRPVVSLPGHRGNLTALAFDADGRRLAGADDKTVKVWDLGRLRDELAHFDLGW